MKKLLLLAALLIAGQAHAQAPQAPDNFPGGYYNSAPFTLSTKQPAPFQLDTNGNLKVNVASGGGSGGTSSTFNAAFPATGTAIGQSSGGNMVPFVSTNGTALDVNCTVGCAGGSFNNNADNVATSASNGQAAAWAYVWDGSAWDRLYGDSTNGAFVNVKTGTLTAVTTITNPVTVTDGAGSLNVIVDSGTLTAVTSITNSVAVTQASGSVASGAYSSGAFASGSIASGALASGSIAAGAIAAGATAIAENEDTASASLDRGVKALVIQRATPADTAADLDYSFLQMSAGRLWTSTVIDSVTATNISTNLAQIAGNTASTGNGGTGTGVLRVAQVNDGTGVLATVTNVATIGTSVTPGTAAANLGKAEDAALGSGDTGVMALAVQIATPADSAADNDYSPLQMKGGLLFTTALGSTVGGNSSYVVEPGASDNHVVIKAGAGTVYGIIATTKHTAAQYLRLYNATTGFNGCNSATNIQFEAIVPAASTGAGFVIPLPAGGIAFATGISICFTGAYGNTDTTSATASVSTVNVVYK